MWLLYKTIIDILRTLLSAQRQSHTAPEQRRCPLQWCWRKIRIPPESWLNADHFYQSKKTILQSSQGQRLIFFQRLFSNLLLWKKTSSITRIIFLLLVLYLMLLQLCLIFKKFLQFESPRLLLNQNKGCRRDFFDLKAKVFPRLVHGLDIQVF